MNPKDPAADKAGEKPKPAKAGVPPTRAPKDAGKRPIGRAISGKRTPALSREMLTVELRRVRSLFLEIAERYLADTEGRIVALIGDLEARKPPAPAVERLLEEIRALKVKPRKGRRKDLGRIETMLDSLRKTLDG